MNELIMVGATGNAERMSSREVARVTGKRHDNVMRDIQNLLKQGVSSLNFEESEYLSDRGKIYHEYLLTEKGCLILASGYNAKLREQIIDRWKELEMAAQQTQFQIPTTLSGALRLAAQQAEHIEEQQKQIGAQNRQICDMTLKIEDMQQKVSYMDVILSSKSTIKVTQIAQDYGMSAKAFNSTLKEMKIQHKVGKQWILYSKHIGEGYVHSSTFETKHDNGRVDVHLNTQWTQKGRLFLYDELKRVNILPLIEKDNNSNEQ